MLKSQEKEFEILQNDKSEIKKFINHFINLIIGTNGLLFGIIVFLSNENEITPLTRLLLLLIGIITLSFLFRIIIYKFNSHNKLAGYIRLLTQEVDYIDNNKKKKKKNQKVCSNVDFEGILISWEYIMGKWDKLIPRNKFPEESFKKIKFYFQPSNDELKNLNDTDKSIDKVRYDYFNSIKDNETKNNEKINFLKYIIFKNNRILNSFESYFICITKVYSHYIKKIFYKDPAWIYKVFRINRTYKKYRTSSWKYPKVIFSIFTIIYAIISILIFHLYSTNPSLSNFKIENQYNLSFFNDNQLFIWILLGVLMILNYFFFLKETVRVLKLDKSVDFYCWAFLPFRVKLLNEYDFIPIFSSNYFKRYKGSLNHLYTVEKNKENENLTDKELENLKKFMIEGEKITSKKLKKLITKYKLLKS